MSAVSDTTGLDSDINDTDDAQGDETVKQKMLVVTLLESPMVADISRPRKNEPPRGKRQCRGKLSSDPKGVTPSQHVTV